MSNKIVYIMQRGFLNINSNSVDRACACTCDFCVCVSLNHFDRSRLVSIHTKPNITKRKLSTVLNNAQCTYTQQNCWVVSFDGDEKPLPPNKNQASGVCNRLPFHIPMVVSFTLPYQVQNTIMHAVSYRVTEFGWKQQAIIGLKLVRTNQNITF